MSVQNVSRLDVSLLYELSNTSTYVPGSSILSWS